MLTPLTKYQSDIESGILIADESQAQAVHSLQQLFIELQRADQQVGSYLHILTSFSKKCFKLPVTSIKGLYFWGGVGRGKTYLIDSFFACLPFRAKRRVHFHRFMQDVHNQLKLLGNIENPLVQVASLYAKQTRVICFDEFYVGDITDAMLLGGLLQAFFDQGITLVASSNQQPDDLYRGGLQRERFLPAIELIKQYTYIVNVDSGVDYRLNYFNQAEIYHTPLNDNSDQLLQQHFQKLSPSVGQEKFVLDIMGRPIKTQYYGDGVAWFDFYELCDQPRGAIDYIEIACLCQTVLLARIPIMNDNQNNMARRFISLVDEFYDRKVKLIITAEGGIDQLYCGQRLAEIFKRTHSRLTDMQTHEYLAQPHIP